MKIGIFSFKKFEGMDEAGSSTIRCDWLLNYWKEAEEFKYGQKYDAIIYQKVYYPKHAKLFKGVKILDLCVSGNSLIFTLDGWKYAKDIIENDYILTHKGRFKKIKNIFVRNDKTKNVKASGLCSIKLTGNHPVYSANYKYNNKKGKVFDNFNWVNVDNLIITKGKNNGSTLITHKNRDINEKELTAYKDEAWFTGYYCAEGSCSDHQVSFAMHKNEIEHRKKIINIIHNFGFNSSYYEKDNTGRVYFSSKHWVELLKDKFKSKDKKVPYARIFNATKEEKLDFLEGYIAGDGYCNDINGISVSTISKKLAYSVWQLFRDCGINVSMNYHKREGDSYKFIHKDGREYYGKPQWRIQLNPIESIKFYNLTNIKKYKKCKIDYWNSLVSKNVEVIESNGYYTHPVKSITDNNKIETVYNFEVEDDNSYIVDGIIVHNCDPDFLHWGYQTKAMIEEVDAITCATKKLAEDIKHFTDKPVIYIPDRIDLKLFNQIIQNNEDAKVVAWFGYGHNFCMLDPVINFLAKHKLKLIVISNADYRLPTGCKKIEFETIKFNWDILANDLKKYKVDFILNPKSKKGKWKYKSDNKSYIGWAMGYPVAYDLDDLVKFINPQNRQLEIELRKKELNEKYNVKLSINELKTLIAEIIKKKNA